MDQHQPPSRILVVDDNEIVRETFSELLIHDGYEVLSASDGLGALTTVPEFLPDVILLDVMMPILDGFSVCRRLKNDPKWQHIPIILVTALDSKADLLRGLEAGADEFLSKPVDRVELRARLRTMLRIKKQYDRLQESLKMREDLVHMVVHDMRSPLTVITMHSSLLAMQQAGLSLDQQESVEAILNQANRLNAFANDLLLLGKMDSGQLIIKRQTVVVSNLLLPLQEQYDLLFYSSGLRFELDDSPQPYPVQLDPGLFTRVIDNLLGNALKISSPGDTITLQVQYPREEMPAAPDLRILVMDQGPGVPPEHREMIFDKFKTVAVKKQGVLQTGLGLAFCKMCVEAHNGRIYVTDNQPKGAIFVVEI